ncbi:MAG: AGE family epimerase/isomerase [Vibrio sp.]
MLELTQFKQQLNDEAKNILEFWLGLQDNQQGGFYCYADFVGKIDPQHNKAVLLHSRILWTFSAAYRILGDDRYLQAAQHCYQFIIEKALDQQHGGVFWLLDKNGNVVDSQKHIYNQGFAIYALSEFYLASGDPQALAVAMSLFELIESHAFDATFGGYREAFDRTWDPIENQLVCDTAEGVLAEKSMNTHLHVLEAYTLLHQASQDPRVASQLAALSQIMAEKVVNDTLHYGLFFTRDWRCVSQDISYGHDIEGTWLMDAAAQQLSDAQLAAKIVAQSSAMAQITAQQGIDRDGAIFNELREGHLLDCDRIWWVQAEAMVGFFNAYQKDRRPQQLANALGCWTIIQHQLKDHLNGEWYWKVNRCGQPYRNTAKVEPWKCPYHNGRACLEMIKRITDVEQTGQVVQATAR